MSCPHLKEVVMLFCDAYPVKKMLPLDRIATADPCLGQFHDCPLFREAMARLAAMTGTAVEAKPSAAPKEAPR
ncbi:MAG TPA: hypothetical protein VK886_16190 [Vicinamibacterales bacterium]|nr:hypothetical protein [Vicinamibacterales bacterium]